MVHFPGWEWAPFFLHPPGTIIWQSRDVLVLVSEEEGFYLGNDCQTFTSNKNAVWPENQPKPTKTNQKSLWESAFALSLGWTTEDSLLYCFKKYKWDRRALCHMIKTQELDSPSYKLVLFHRNLTISCSNCVLLIKINFSIAPCWYRRGNRTCICS